MSALDRVEVSVGVGERQCTETDLCVHVNTELYDSINNSTHSLYDYLAFRHASKQVK